MTTLNEQGEPAKAGDRVTKIITGAAEFCQDDPDLMVAAVSVHPDLIAFYHEENEPVEKVVEGVN